MGAIVEYLFAPADPAAVLARLRDPAIRIVSLTITEGGYNLDEATGQFRLDAPDIAHDLAHPEAPRTVFGFIVAGLAQRRAAGLPARSPSCPATISSTMATSIRSGGAGVRRCPRPGARRLDRGQRHLPQLHGRPHHAGRDAGRRGAAERADRHRRPGAGVRRGLHPVGGGGPVLRRPAGAGAGRRAVHATMSRRTSRSSCACSTPRTACCPTRACWPATGSCTRRMADPRHPGLPARLPRPRRDPAADARPPGMALAAYRDTRAGALRQSRPSTTSSLRITSDGASKIPVFLGDTLRAVPGGRRRPSAARLPARRLRPLSRRPRRPWQHAFEPAGAASDRGRPRARGRPRTRGGPPDRHASRAWSWSGRRAFVASFVRYRAIARRARHAGDAGRDPARRREAEPCTSRSTISRAASRSSPAAARASASPAPRRWARRGRRWSWPRCCRTGSRARSTS